MQVNGKHYRTIWENPIDPRSLLIIDQRLLPHKFEIAELNSLEEIANAISDMQLRGAPLIGVAAAYGMYLAAVHAPDSMSFDAYMYEAANILTGTRPTAINLAWAVERQINTMLSEETVDQKISAALKTARGIAERDVEMCCNIGMYGSNIIEEISKSKPGEPVNILTHCNAGWLAAVDWGTATAPIYYAREKNIPIHVWVDETRPRNQGAKLTAWELLNMGIPHTIIADNAGGHLMQHGLVDICIVGSDRTTFTGDVANKIGTYLKALAAFDNRVPFYVAQPSSTIDWSIADGIHDIPIERRNADEVIYVEGLLNGEIARVQVPPTGSPAANYAFDVTPARLITGLITERGVCRASRYDLERLYPEYV